MNIEDCWRTLELEPGATLEEIRAARNELLQVWHPDKYASNSKLSEKAKEKTLKINEAFGLLVSELDVKRQTAQKNNDAADFQKELQHYSKKQEARIKYQDRLNDQKERAKRQLNLTVLFAFLAGIFGLIMGLKDWAFFWALVVLMIGLVISFLTYRKPIRKIGSRPNE